MTGPRGDTTEPRQWGRGAWRGRPPWWPEGEPFPPPEWRRRAPQFRRRFFVFALLAFVMFAFFISFFVFVLLQAFTAIIGGPPHPIFIVLALLFVFFAITGGMRGASRLARPVGDLIDAVERIEHGDYTGRVTPPRHAPREVRGLANAFNAMSERLEQSEAERRRLLADVTHELRTPLTVIQGNIEALIDGVRPTDEAHLRAILDDTHVLARLIDDLRTVSVAEAGALPLHREETDLGALVRETVLSFQAPATAAGVTFAIETAGNLTLNVDPVRVREVLTNVIANALRYTPAGGRISVRATGYERDATIAVADTGPGIAADVLPHVFERFTRSPESPGAGLGLAIAKSLVVAHGGTIDARSELGRGTEIFVRLPRNPAS